MLKSQLLGWFLSAGRLSLAVTVTSLLLFGGEGHADEQGAALPQNEEAIFLEIGGDAGIAPVASLFSLLEPDTRVLELVDLHELGQASLVSRRLLDRRLIPLNAEAHIEAFETLHVSSVFSEPSGGASPGRDTQPHQIFDDFRSQLDLFLSGVPGPARATLVIEAFFSEEPLQAKDRIDLLHDFVSLNFGFTAIFVGKPGSHCHDVFRHRVREYYFGDQLPVQRGSMNAAVAAANIARLANPPQLPGATWYARCADTMIVFAAGNPGDKRGRAHKPTLEDFSYLERVRTERQMADRFFASGDMLSGVRYLQECMICRDAERVANKVRTLKDAYADHQRTRAVWLAIVEDGDLARAERFLEACGQRCRDQSTYVQEVARLKEVHERQAWEAALYEDILKQSAIDDMELYLESCGFCLHQEAVASMLRVAEEERARDIERERLQHAVSAAAPEAIRTWLSQCVFCTEKAEAQEALAVLSKAQGALSACTRMAGPHEREGPITLAGVDLDVAQNTCETAQRQLPTSAYIATLLGRIAEARGDRDVASRAFERGRTEQVPFAWGLSAQRAYHEAYWMKTDPQDAIEFATVGRTLGDASSVVILFLSRGGGQSEAVSQDLVDEMEALATRGYTPASLVLSFAYRVGYGVPRSDEKADAHTPDAASAESPGYLAMLMEAALSYGATPAITAALADLYMDALQDRGSLAGQLWSDDIARRPDVVVIEMQKRLSAAGFFYGAVDVAARDALRSAIEDYTAWLEASRPRDLSSRALNN